MNFLAGVNRILRANGHIRGDDDDILTFSDIKQNATLNIAMIAIQDELSDLISDKLIPYEHTTGTVTTSSGVRAYALPTDFVQFFGQAHLTLSSGNAQLFEYSGGLEQLQMDVMNYDTQTGTPNWWYFEPATTKQIGFFPTPNLMQTWGFHYEKDVSVTLSSDTLPFHSEQEAQAFCAAAGRRFKFLYEDAQNTDMVLKQDESYTVAKGRLVRLIAGKNPSTRYGKQYL